MRVTFLVAAVLAILLSGPAQTQIATKGTATTSKALIDKKGLTGDYVLEVKTTINLPLQTAAQNIINEEVALNNEKYHVTQGAAVVMAPDGALRAIVGGIDYEQAFVKGFTEAGGRIIENIRMPLANPDLRSMML